MMKAWWLFFSISFAAGHQCSSVAQPAPPNVPQETIKQARVLGIVQKDWRGRYGYMVEFNVTDTSTGVSRLARLVRTWEEFETLSNKWHGKTPIPLPLTASVAGLDNYLQSAITSDMNPSQLLDDFAGINYVDCFKLKWFRTVFDLIFIFTARQPSFDPSPPNVTRETMWQEETGFECWLYLMAWQSHKNTSYFQPLLNAYTELMPEFESGFPEDNRDVWAPGVTREAKYPFHYTRTFVHFLPGGFKNSKNIRLSYLGKNKFSFLEARNLDVWLRKLAPIYETHAKPQRILDVGTGQCYSAFAFSRLYPNSEIIGIDMSPGQIRFCRMWAEKEGIKNVKFYWANAEHLPFESASFDIVQFTYVLHEMPQENAFRVVREMWRVLKPGGVLSGFEVPFFGFAPVRYFMSDVSTWGENWRNFSSSQGPEPYFGEYQNFNLIEQLKDAQDEPEIHCQTVFDMVMTLVKGKKPSPHACPKPKPALGFETDRLRGKWYEIGKIQTTVGAFFEGKCECTQLSFDTKGDETATVSNACRKGGRTEVVNTTLSPVVSGRGVFKEHFRWGPFTNSVDYTVIAMDVDGEEYLVEYDCSVSLGIRSYCFHVMARQPSMNASRIDKLLKLANEQLNPNGLSYKQTIQKGCWKTLTV